MKTLKKGGVTKGAIIYLGNNVYNTYWTKAIFGKY